MKRFIKMCALALTLVLTVCCLPHGALSASSDASSPRRIIPGGDASQSVQAEPALRFGPDGTFTILLLAALQDTQFPSPYLTRSIRAVIRDYPPDFIVLLGNQLDGGNPLLRLGNGYENVKRAFDRMLAPIVASQIPFTVLFGPSDYRAPISIDRQAELYHAYPNCVLPASVTDGVTRLPVYGGDDSALLLNLYFFNPAAEAGASDSAISSEQVTQYITQSDLQRENNVNQSVPSVAFMHAAVPEIYELFSRTAVSDPDAVRGEGDASQEYYRLDSERIFSGEAQQAPETSIENNGLFDAFVEQNDVFLSVSGRDYTNSFIGTLNGVDLLSAPGSTFTGFNDRAVRGARLLRFTEFNIRDYETVHVRYSDYDSADRAVDAIPYYLSTTTRIPNWVKSLLIVLAFAALLAMLIVSICRSRHDDPQPDDSDDDEQSEPSEKLHA